MTFGRRAPKWPSWGGERGVLSGLLVLSLGFASCGKAVSSEGSGTPSAGGGGEAEPGTGGGVGDAGGSGAGGAGASGSGGSGSGGSGSGSSTASCEVWAEKFAVCAPNNSACPFSEPLTTCESYCLAELNCNFYDPEATDPGERWGYGGCFESCAVGFYCPSDERILPAHQVCDGVSNCSGEEDEADGSCGTVDSGFLCDGERIPRRNVCDGTADCGDGSDESTCPGFLCHDGLLIVPSAARCDHTTTECADQSDEFDCPER